MADALDGPDADVTVLIPAYNEADRIGPVVAALARDYPVLVVDDASTDRTVAVAEAAGATVLRHAENRGYLAALRRGFDAVTTPVVVTLDADGEHDPDDVPAVAAPVLADEADLVFGVRETVPRPSERVLSWLANRHPTIDVRDTGTGFRALRTELARRLEIGVACPCGTLALEAAARGARLGTVPIQTRPVAKPRGIAWGHARQLVAVLRRLLSMSAVSTIG